MPDDPQSLDPLFPPQPPDAAPDPNALKEEPAAALAQPSQAPSQFLPENFAALFSWVRSHTMGAVNLELSAVLGSRKMMIGQILKIGRGAVIDLGAEASSPVELSINNCAIARGEIRVVGDHLAVEITQFVHPSQATLCS